VVTGGGSGATRPLPRDNGCLYYQGFASLRILYDSCGENPVTEL